MASPIEQDQNSEGSQQISLALVVSELLERIAAESLGEQGWPQRSFFRCPACSANLQVLTYAEDPAFEHSEHKDLQTLLRELQSVLYQKESKDTPHG
jgi:hypothetical protein